MKQKDIDDLHSYNIILDLLSEIDVRLMNLQGDSKWYKTVYKPHINNFEKCMLQEMKIIESISDLKDKEWHG